MINEIKLKQSEIAAPEYDRIEVIKRTEFEPFDGLKLPLLRPLHTRDSQSSFEDAKYGMFIHWGLYSLLSNGEWIQFEKNIPTAEYKKLIHQFNPKNFDPKNWVESLCQNKIRYVVITARHHDGFSLFKTSHDPEWSISNTPYGKDILKPLAEACREHGIMVFFYYSLLDWVREDYRNDFHSYLSFINKQLAELCENYGRIDGIWFDGVNFITDWRKWDFETLFKTIRTRQPHALICVNQAFLEEGNRITIHDDIDFITYEKNGVRPLFQNGPKYIARECCDTIGVDAWGYRKEEKCILPEVALYRLLANVCRGGNFLLNTGPDDQGSIPKPHKSCFSYIGNWMNVNAGAICGTRPSGLRIESFGGSVVKGDSIFWHFWKRPENGIAVFEKPHYKISSVRVYNTPFKVDFNIHEDEIHLDLSKVSFDDPFIVLEGKMVGKRNDIKIECEDYVPGGRGVYHHPTTHVPMEECYRKDDLGCEFIDFDNGVAVRTRKNMEYLYHFYLPYTGKYRMLLRGCTLEDNRASEEPFSMSICLNSKTQIKDKILPLPKKILQTQELGVLDVQKGEYYLTLKVNSGCGLIDYIKFSKI